MIKIVIFNQTNYWLFIFFNLIFKLK